MSDSVGIESWTSLQGRKVFDGGRGNEEREGRKCCQRSLGSYEEGKMRREKGESAVKDRLEVMRRGK